MSTAVIGPVSDGLTHDGLLYRSDEDYVAGVTSFLTSGIERGLPTFVAVPWRNVLLLRDGLGDTAREVQFEDMTVIGHNPARIIPAIRRFLDSHRGSRVKFVGEPIWPGRTPAEIVEATRHEAMLNTAFAAAAVDILCPYDVIGLDPATVADAWRTHPTVVDGDARLASSRYEDPARIYLGDDPALPPPAVPVEAVTVDADSLAMVRELVRACADTAGLSAKRSDDLVLAVNEIATNSIIHGGGSGSLRLWHEPPAVICELRDGGHLTDPLAGRRRPADHTDHGRGLWMANQLCDLVQIRSNETGTTIRLHVRATTG
ncbi:MAG TPA: sensor histidine kinase [Mycobacteriales bacterium]|nr:sensor histidine kinase [Mycobacteriales bacterium]